MAVIEVAANAAGGTVVQRSMVKVRADYSGPLSYPEESQPLYRVSQTYAQPTALDAFGRPPEGHVEASSEVVEEWGRLAVFIGGKDVSYFRGAPTSINTISWQRLGNFETAEFEIPAISIFETMGVGALKWLKDNAFVRIVRVDADNSITPIWLGTVNSITQLGEGIGLRITAHGLLYDIFYQVVRPPLLGSSASKIEDIGVDIAATLNGVRGHWSAVEPVVTGSLAQKSGSWETGLDYLKSLLSLAPTENATAWTVWLDAQARASIVEARNIPGRKTVSLVAGQGGVEDGLVIDSLTVPNIIYGDGMTTGGAAWRNTMYPASSIAIGDRFPMDNPEEVISEGSEDASTSTGNGVSMIRFKLAALNYGVTLGTKYTEAVTGAVAKFQKAKKLPQTGNVDVKTWSKLFGYQDITRGAWIAPLAHAPNAWPRLFDAVGKDIGPNLNFDASVRPIEKKISFGSGVSLAQAKQVAEAALRQIEEPVCEGDLSLTVCPPQGARFDIRPGDTVNYLGRFGRDLELLVHRVEWNLSDVPTVKLTVSTRDMDMSELDAALNRLRNANVGITRSTSIEAPKSLTTGVSTQPLFTAPATVAANPVAPEPPTVYGIREVWSLSPGSGYTQVPGTYGHRIHEGMVNCLVIYSGGNITLPKARAGVDIGWSITGTDGKNYSDAIPEGAVIYFQPAGRYVKPDISSSSYGHGAGDMAYATRFWMEGLNANGSFLFSQMAFSQNGYSFTQDTVGTFAARAMADGGWEFALLSDQPFWVIPDANGGRQYGNVEGYSKPLWR